jgi:hypothetical protein
MFCFHYLVLHPQKTRFNTYSILCYHVLLSQEPHSIYVLFLLYCLANAQKWDSIHVLFFVFMSYFHNNNTPHVLFFVTLSCFCYVILCPLKKKDNTQYKFCNLLSWLASTQTTLCVQWQDHVSTTMATFY